MDKKELKNNIGDIISKIISGETTYEEIGYSYYDLRMIIPQWFSKGTLGSLERRYKEEQRLKEQFENVPEEELRRQLIEEQQDLRYLEAYLDLIERFYYRIDFEKMKRKIPVDKLCLLREDIAHAESKSISSNSKKHPLYGALIDFKDNKKWDLMSHEHRVTRIKSLIKSKKIRINYLSKLLYKLHKLQEKNAEENDRDKKTETQTAELERLIQRSHTLDMQIQAAEALEKDLIVQQNGDNSIQVDVEAK